MSNEKKLTEMSTSTQAIHADDYLNAGAQDVAPPMHVSTNFRYPDEPEQLVPFTQLDLTIYDKHIYSRDTAPNSTRFEAILSSLLKGKAVSYSSGLSAYHAALVYLNPKRISIGHSYHGCHGVISLHEKLSGLKKLPLDCPDEDLQAGDIIHVETPINPTGEAISIEKYAKKAHARGAYLLVDATFGPPGLQDPFIWGADIILHSGTKYLGGHSDILCGVLAVQRDDWFRGLREERNYLGSMMGSFEGWLGIRSLRTLELRVQRQSQNAESLVRWLDDVLLLHPAEEEKTKTSSTNDDEVVRAAVEQVSHASLQKDDMDWLQKQMPNGYGPVFSIWMKNEQLAMTLPSMLKLFNHATSLGGVQSSIEWRKMTDPKCDPRLLRVSIGVESWEDLRDDLLEGFRRVVGRQEKKKVGKGDVDDEELNGLVAEHMVLEKKDDLLNRILEVEQIGNPIIL